MNIIAIIILSLLGGWWIPELVQFWSTFAGHPVYLTFWAAFLIAAVICFCAPRVGNLLFACWLITLILQHFAVL